METRNQKPYGRNYEKTLTDISLRWNFLGEIFTALLGLGGIFWMDFFSRIEIIFLVKSGTYLEDHPPVRGRTESSYINGGTEKPFFLPRL